MPPASGTAPTSTVDTASLLLRTAASSAAPYAAGDARGPPVAASGQAPARCSSSTALPTSLMAPYACLVCTDVSDQSDCTKTCIRPRAGASQQLHRLGHLVRRAAFLGQNKLIVAGCRLGRGIMCTCHALGVINWRKHCMTVLCKDCNVKIRVPKHSLNLKDSLP